MGYKQMNLKIKILWTRFKKSRFLLAVVMLTIGYSGHFIRTEAPKLYEHIRGGLEIIETFELSQEMGESVKADSFLDNVQDTGSESSLESLIQEAFGDESERALKIMNCESSGDETRIGDGHLAFEYNGQTYGKSIGLFQIRTGGNEHGKIWVRTDNVKKFEEDMKIPAKNILMARKIYDESGKNFSKWTCDNIVDNQI